MDVYVLNLATPKQAHGERIDTLTFRAPKARDFFELGYPYKSQADARDPTVITQVLDMRACRGLLARMAQVPTSTIDELSFQELSEALGVIPSFLGAQTPSPSSGIASKSVGSGAVSTSA